MNISYKTKGTCSTQIDVEAENGIVKNVKFFGGCSGNAQGVSRLVVGMKIDEAIEKLAGIDCAGRGTSCPDQLSKALAKMI